MKLKGLNSKKVSYTKYATINPTKESSLILDDASTYLVCYAGIDSDNIRNIGFSVVISRSSSNTKGSVLNVKTEVSQIKLSLNENVLKITATVWGRISAIKLWNSKSLSTIRIAANSEATIPLPSYCSTLAFGTVASHIDGFYLISRKSDIVSITPLINGLRNTDFQVYVANDALITIKTQSATAMRVIYIK